MLHIVALRYLEPYYADTVRCLEACGLPVTYVDRPGGVGNMSDAFNRGFNTLPDDVKHVWFTSDITFEPWVPRALSDALESDCRLSGIHPAHPSDHLSHRPDGTSAVRLVPYIEFTAAMVRADVYRGLGGLDSNYWYWYQDLLFSKAVRDSGGRLAVHHGAQVGHVYRRGCVTSPITRQRYSLRKQRDYVERPKLAKRFGPDWRDILWCTGDHTFQYP